MTVKEKLRMVGTLVTVMVVAVAPAAPAFADPEAAPPAPPAPPPAASLLEPAAMLVALDAALLAAALAEADFDVEGVIVRLAAAVVGVLEPAAPLEDRPDEEELPPTTPANASTMHLTVVLAELSTDPVSTTTTASGADTTSKVRSAGGGDSHSFCGERPAFQPA